jgi:hypothetical protein
LGHDVNWSQDSPFDDINQVIDAVHVWIVGLVAEARPAEVFFSPFCGQLIRYRLPKELRTSRTWEEKHGLHRALPKFEWGEKKLRTGRGSRSDSAHGPREYRAKLLRHAQAHNADRG